VHTHDGQFSNLKDQQHLMSSGSSSLLKRSSVDFSDLETESVVFLSCLLEFVLTAENLTLGSFFHCMITVFIAVLY
jgi:hypothetical protein